MIDMPVLRKDWSESSSHCQVSAERGWERGRVHPICKVKITSHDAKGWESEAEAGTRVPHCAKCG